MNINEHVLKQDMFTAARTNMQDSFTVERVQNEWSRLLHIETGSLKVTIQKHTHWKCEAEYPSSWLW